MSATAVSVLPSAESDAPDNPPKSPAALVSAKPARYSSRPVVTGVEAPLSGATGVATTLIEAAPAGPVDSRPRMKRPMKASPLDRPMIVAPAKAGAQGEQQ